MFLQWLAFLLHKPRAQKRHKQWGTKVPNQGWSPKPNWMGNYNKRDSASGKTTFWQRRASATPPCPLLHLRSEGLRAFRSHSPSGESPPQTKATNCINEGWRSVHPHQAQIAVAWINSSPSSFRQMGIQKAPVELGNQCQYVKSSRFNFGVLGEWMRSGLGLLVPG